MIKPDQIPDDVVEAAREAWLRLDVSAKEDWRASIAAAINAWPGMICYPPDPLDEIINPERIILPLPEAPQGRIAKQESGDDQA